MNITRQPPPLVLVCGWTNADKIRVEQYVEMYKSLGFRSMMLQSKGVDFFLPERWVHPLNKSNPLFHDENKDQILDIIPHILSNGGCRSWYCFENQLIHSRIQYRILSFVFDSSPSIPLSSITHYEDPFPMQQFLSSKYLWKWILFALHFLLWFTGRKHPFTLHYLRYFIRDASIPKLFLYSSADELVGLSNIHGVMKTAQSMGSKIISVDFQISKHVSHYHSNPILYEKSVHLFLAMYLPK